MDGLTDGQGRLPWTPSGKVGVQKDWQALLHMTPLSGPNNLHSIIGGFCLPLPFYINTCSVSLSFCLSQPAFSTLSKKVYQLATNSYRNIYHSKGHRSQGDGVCVMHDYASVNISKCFFRVLSYYFWPKKI